MAKYKNKLKNDKMAQIAAMKKEEEELEKLYAADK
jgi:N-methylhydantoinase B/oxoprolinase/acetone carboxylase alpha subunit